MSKIKAEVQRTETRTETFTVEVDDKEFKSEHDKFQEAQRKALAKAGDTVFDKSGVVEYDVEFV